MGNTTDNMEQPENINDQARHPETEHFIFGQRLCKGFNTSESRIDVLRDVEFHVDTGETIAIVGASGIGKSTFLHILGTLDRPDSGILYFQGRNVFQLDDIQLASHRNTAIGFVFQFHHLLPEFSALENVMMPALINGFDRKKAEEASEEVLVRVSLQERLAHRVNELSGGEQQRVALARALVLKPSLLLADEPTGNLDRKNSDQIHALLFELNQELSMTMVVVTHNMELAAIMSRKVTIDGGQLVDM
jgi:lipoprotein-releasing system ATP-binding protein